MSISQTLRWLESDSITWLVLLCCSIYPFGLWIHCGSVTGWQFLSLTFTKKRLCFSACWYSMTFSKEVIHRCYLKPSQISIVELFAKLIDDFLRENNKKALIWKFWSCFWCFTQFILLFHNFVISLYSFLTSFLVKDTLKAFGDFKCVWRNLFWYVKVCIFWKCFNKIHYTLRWNISVNKIPSDKINGTKNVLFCFTSSRLSQFYF